MTSNAPIVVIDSGLGGLTVASALQQALPHEQLLYFGDTARVPYGSKSPTNVLAFVSEIISYFLPHDPKHVVIACNTASALALAELRAQFPQLSISGVIEPGAKAAAIAAGKSESPLIGIIATEATIRSKAYERAIHRRRNRARLLLRPAPLLVPIIEEGRTSDDPLVGLALHQYLSPLFDRGIEVLVLGCTHYPIYKEAIATMAGEHVRVIDSAQQCAEDVARRLTSAGLLRSQANDAPRIKCYVSDQSPRFSRLAARFMGMNVDPPTLVSIDDLHDCAQQLELRFAG